MSKKSLLDLTKFDFSKEEIRAINEIIFEELTQAPELASLHSIWTGIEYKRQIGFITGSGLVGKKKQGCNPTPHDWEINTRAVTWDPVDWQIIITECADTLNDTAATYCRNKGVRIDDLTDTDYMDILITVLKAAIKDFLIRLVWFNDVDADNVDFEDLPTAAISAQTAGSAISGTVYEGVTATTQDAVKCALSDGTIVYLAGSAATGTAASGKTYYTKDTANTVHVNTGGLLTSGLDADYFNLLDGFFKQLQVAVTEHNARLINITANNAETKALQLAGMTPDVAYTLLNSMYYALPAKVRKNGNVRFYVTQTIVDAYEQYLSGKNLEVMYYNLVDGIKAFKFRSVDVVPMPIWDEMIQSYFDLGDTYYKPHRAVLIEQENLAVGTPSEDVIDDLDVFYDRTTHVNHIEAADRIDAKLLNYERFVYAQ